MTAIKGGRRNPLTPQQIASFGHQILTVNDIMQLKLPSHNYSSPGNGILVWTGVSPSWTCAHWEYLCGGGHVSTRGI